MFRMLPLLLKRRPGRWAATIALGGLLVVSPFAADPAAGKTGMITTTDGQVFQGELDETTQPGKVVITGKGGSKTTIHRRMVDKVFYFNTPREEFDARLSVLKPDDANGRVALAQWALTEAKQPEMAKEALDQALKITPNHPQATTMLTDAKKQIAAKPPPATNPATAPAVAGGGNDVKPPPAAAGAGRFTAKRMVTAEEMNRVRQEEWKANDTTVRAKVPPDVRKAYIDASPNPAVVGKMLPAELALDILQHGTPAMKKEVLVQSDPLPITQYKQRVNKVLAAQCIQCHTVGKTEGDNPFGLFAENTDAAYISNFVILQSYERAPVKEVDEVQRSMIDRTRPESSLLLQYALPPLQAEVPHPKVPKYTGAVKNKAAPAYRDLVQWVGSLSPIPPKYDIDLSSDPKPEKGAEAPAAAAAAASRPPVKKQ